MKAIASAQNGDKNIIASRFSLNIHRNILIINLITCIERVEIPMRSVQTKPKQNGTQFFCEFNYTQNKVTQTFESTA